MMRTPSRSAVQALRERYPKGTTVELISMEDAYALPAGTRGTVIDVDDIGDIHVAWSTGRTLALIPGVDRWKVVQEND